MLTSSEVVEFRSDRLTSAEGVSVRRERPVPSVRFDGELNRPVLKHGPRSPYTCASMRC